MMGHVRVIMGRGNDVSSRTNQPNKRMKLWTKLSQWLFYCLFYFF